MKDQTIEVVEPCEEMLQAWIYRDSWSTDEAVQLALGFSPEHAPSQQVQDLVARAKQEGRRRGPPMSWLWWGERNALPFHAFWWEAISPSGPIGFDGRHIAHLRPIILSPEYLRQERRLIGEWWRKPSWTPREAIDLSLNFDPFSTQSWQGEAPETGETTREREDRFAILERAFELGEIAEKSSPKAYLTWLIDRGYYISASWQRAAGIESAGLQNFDSAPSPDLIAENQALREQLQEQSAFIADLEQKNRELSTATFQVGEKSALTNRLKALQKTLIATAVDAHKYDPRKQRSDVPQQIADMSVQLGCEISSQTVRKQLREACDEQIDSAVWDDIFP